jgi:hypothetical protein
MEDRVDLLFIHVCEFRAFLGAGDVSMEAHHVDAALGEEAHLPVAGVGGGLSAGVRAPEADRLTVPANEAHAVG